MNSYINYKSQEENPQFIFLEKIKAMFITIIEKERWTNELKLYLSNCLNIDLMNYFSSIDINNKEYIDVKDLDNYLKKYSISFTEQTIRRFIHQFDKHQKFNLLFEDFCRIIEPYSQYNENISQNNNNDSPQDIFLNILVDSFELIELISEMTLDIRKTNNFTSYEAFMGITKGNKYLDEEFMTHFLEHNYNGEEIKHLIYLIDLNNDLLISYEEFQDFFIPLLKYTEELNIKDNFNYEEIIDEKDEKMNVYDSNNNYNYFDNNFPDKYENDIVNYEKSGKFRGKSSNKEKKENDEDNYRFNETTMNMKKNYHNIYNQNQNIRKNNNIVFSNNINIFKEKNNDLQETNDNPDKNYNSMNNLKYNKYKFNKYYQEEYKLKSSDEEENNENINSKESNNDNNHYEIDMDNDYDEYCNFFTKTHKILSSSSKNDDIKYKDNSINDLEKTPNFKYQQFSDKKNENNNSHNNNSQIEGYLNNCNCNNENKKRNYKNIKNDNDYIINILDDNNIRENKKYNIYKINHTEIEYIPKNKVDNNNFIIEKNANIELYKNNNNNENNKKINLNSLNKEDSKININNFTCGGINESEKGNSSSKKINISNSNNNNDSYTLSNENNKLVKNLNIYNTNKNSQNFDLEDKNMILDSFSDKISKEALNKKIKEYNNSSLNNFIKYNQFIVKTEKKTIDSKDKLCLREDISLKDLFFIFDYNKKNSISKKEYKSVCKKLFGLYPTSDQINLVFKRYDKNKDDNLNLREFLGMIKPIKEEYSSFLFNKKNKDNKNEKLGYQKLSMKTKKLLIDVIKNIIEDEGNYYKFKDDIINGNLFDLKELWDFLCRYSNNNKGLDKLEMKKLLMDNGFSLSQYDLDILFNKLDYDDDQIISYEDLNEEFINYY